MVTMTAYEPNRGDIVEDTGHNRVGQVMAFEDGCVQLRPVGGGREWDAKPGDLRPASPAEGLSAKVAVANARSRGELP